MYIDRQSEIILEFLSLGILENFDTHKMTSYKN